MQKCELQDLWTKELLLSHCNQTPKQLTGVYNHGPLKKLSSSLSTFWVYTCNAHPLQQLHIKLLFLLPIVLFVKCHYLFLFKIYLNSLLFLVYSLYVDLDTLLYPGIHWGHQNKNFIAQGNFLFRAHDHKHFESFNVG